MSRAHAPRNSDTYFGWLYFLQEVPNGPIKIGFTGSGTPEGRLRSCQIGNARELALLAAVRAPLLEDARWLARFASQRIRGEWFHQTPELLAAIADVERRPPEIVAPTGKSGTADILAWLKANDIELEAFAHQLGYRPSYFRARLSERSGFSKPFAARIESATGGAIRAINLLSCAKRGARA